MQRFLVIYLFTITIVPPTINTNCRSMITPAKEAMIIAELEGDPEDSRMVDSGVVDIEQSPTWKSKHEQRKLKFIIVLS